MHTEREEREVRQFVLFSEVIVSRQVTKLNTLKNLVLIFQCTGISLGSENLVEDNKLVLLPLSQELSCLVYWEWDFDQGASRLTILIEKRLAFWKPDIYRLDLNGGWGGHCDIEGLTVLWKGFLFIASSLVYLNVSLRIKDYFIKNKEIKAKARGLLLKHLGFLQFSL